MSRGVEGGWSHEPTLLISPDRNATSRGLVTRE